MLFLGIAIGIFALDFFLKRYVEAHFARSVKHPKLKDKVYIEKYYNDGAMFNALEKKPKLLKVIQTVLLIGICIWFYFVSKKSGKTLEKTGLAFLIGGGMNNLWDRYEKGHVVDYIGFSFGPKWFRSIIFNISDFFVFIGAVFTVLGA